jgi:hypothetical protein
MEGFSINVVQNFLINPAGLTSQKFMAERPGKNTGLPDC